MSRYLKGVSVNAFGRGNRRLIAAIAARTSLRPTWGSAAGAAAGTYLAWPTIGHWVPTALTAAAALWTVTAIAAGQGPPKKPTEGGDAKRPANDDQNALLTALHQFMPNPGDRAHLAQVAEHLYGDPKNTAPIRETCTALGITIDQVRVRGRGVSTGIHHRDLPPLPNPSPEGASGDVVGVVGAGHSNNNNAGFTVTDDPESEGKSYVIWAGQPVRKAS